MLSIAEFYDAASVGNRMYPVLNDNPIIKTTQSIKTKQQTNKKTNPHFERKNIKIGTKVKIVRKENQRTENFDVGIVKDILTSKKTHTRGIKVRLENDVVGRVQEIL